MAKKMGRPRLEPGQKAETLPVAFRLSENDMSAVNALELFEAEQGQGESPGKAAKRLALEGLRRRSEMVTFHDLKEALYEAGCIRTELNNKSIFLQPINIYMAGSDTPITIEHDPETYTWTRAKESSRFARIVIHEGMAGDTGPKERDLHINISNILYFELLKR